VLKPNAGVESAGVLPLLLQDDGRYLNPWSGETKHWSQWVAKSAGIHPYGSHDWLIEEMIGDGRKPPYDWKFHCIGGRAMLVSQFRRNGVTRWAKVWSRDFKPLGDVLPNRRMWLKRQRDESMPPPMDGPALIAAAERLAKAVGGMFCRVDLYEDQRGPVFGEITMRPSNVTFAPSLDRELGKEWIAALQRSGAASSS
jgi:hypothetical protein